ncbi:unnamed protein product, partial [Vitis vinifera]
MDDSCAVCAETLEWVSYGPCGHRDVCSTCVARLRFICDDRRCCICKTECNVVFVTKALGDYTRMVNDFSILPTESREGQVGMYWYHEDTQAFFDDVDHYKMIKAMCRLSCSVCDQMEEQSNDGSKRRQKFRNIDQLKGHLFHRHKLFMCSLCLEGRKVFICEQKLYNRAQLNQHINTGDSEVDGNEAERGGFMGHPMCDFCRSPFYGDNELYSHMSTEHYTCHICQRQNPGQFEYYKNYDDLEIHFRRDHFLCEDEACLAKKFVVFQSEAEMKRHNAIEHGGRMSRSKRNAALQIPTSFRYRRSTEQDQRRGRGRTFNRDSSADQLSLAIQASLETANANDTYHDPPPSSSSSTQAVSDHYDSDPIIQPFESLAMTDSESSSRYRQALGHNPMNVPLVESFFPPLATAPSSSKANVLHSGQGWPAPNRGSVPLSSSSTQSKVANIAPVPSSSLDQVKSATGSGSAPNSYASFAQARPTTVHGFASSGSSSNSGSISRISHSASAPNLADSRSFDPSMSDFPPVSATQKQKLPTITQPVLNAEAVHTANKSLVEKIRAALEFDEDKYTAFKDISGQYRQGSIDTAVYLAYVQQFGLSHLVLELARLCPDAQKQKELLETYNASVRSSGKGKPVVVEDSNVKDTLADNIINTVRNLRSTFKPSEEEVEVLSKDGYRGAKGKSKGVPSAGGGSNQNLGAVSGGSQRRKKASKFLRARLGDGSVGALLNSQDPDPDPDPVEETLDANMNPAEGLPVHGVWRNGGGIVEMNGQLQWLSTSHEPFF